MSGCLPKYTTPVRVKDYAGRGAIYLPVGEIKLSSEIETDGRLPHIESAMPMTPERALKNWAFIRLRGTYQKPWTADFVIKRAEMLREDAPQESFFVYDNYKYTLNYDIVLNISDEKGRIFRTYGTSGTIAGTLPMKSSINELDALFVDMLDMMNEDVDKALSEKIKENPLAI